MSLTEALDLCGIEHGEWYSLAAIKDRTIHAECFERGDGERFLEAHESWNLYLCGNPVKPGTHGKPTAADIVTARVLLMDADPDPDEGAAREAAVALHQFCGGTLVDSGRGTQVWVRVAPDLDRPRAGRGLARKFKREGMKWDGTFNVDRLMRLPGYVNHKTGRVAKVLA